MLKQQIVPEAGDELLSHTTRSQVSRKFLASGSVIHKQMLGPGARRRMDRELAVLARLSSVPGVAKLSAVQSATDVIALQDERGVSLATMLGLERLPIADVLVLALQLTKTIAAVHLLGIVHRDLNPTNILMVGPERTPVLIDFDIASSFAEERAGFAAQAEIEGTLAYIAPEQTGRTGRVTDLRADLYALGATFYELATGRTPFGGEDPFEVVRDHLVRLPSPPSTVDPEVPQAFSDIIMRLLEKEPDRRYQSAEGLAADLALVSERVASGRLESFPLGERDFPRRLLPPSRLFGRETQIAVLNEAFEASLKGRSSALLVAGAPGIGKTALVNELRAIAAANGGLFVAGKFDRYRQDADSDAVQRAFRSLLGLLLTEPEEELVRLRACVLEALGAFAGIWAAVLPELGLLLRIEADMTPADPVRVRAQLVRAGFELLKCIASPTRPVVFVVDDLQWAPATALAFMDAVISDGGTSGLVLVGAYRASEIDAASPFAAMLTRWDRLSEPPRRLHLDALKPDDVGGLLQEMLRLRPEPAKKLAEVLDARTAGNPYDTVELINALRRDGALTPGAAGWDWDEAAVRHFSGHGDVLTLLGARIAALPAPSIRILERMACLGGNIHFGLLQAAGDCSLQELDRGLDPALGDGLIVFDYGAERSIRFRHDRIQQAALGRLESHERVNLHLEIARRLAAFPRHENVAAEQYLPAAGLLHEPAECRDVIALFRRAAVQARMLANHADVESFIAAARRLLPLAALAGGDVEKALDDELHAGLYSLGRLDEADALFASIALRGGEALQAVDSTCIQINSLTIRNRPLEALSLGLALLEGIGMAVPQRSDLGSEIEHGLNEIDLWCEEEASEQPLHSAGDGGPGLVAAAKIIARLMPTAYFCDAMFLAWLVIAGLRLWREHGPRDMLVGPISNAGFVAIATRGDYRTAYRAARRILAESERRAYDDAAQARFLFSLGAQHWFEPPEDCLLQAHAAFAGLVRSGDLQNACFTYFSSINLQFQCASTLEECSAEIEAGIAFSIRMGNSRSEASYVIYRQLVKAMRGETEAPGSFDDASFDEERHLAALRDDPVGSSLLCIWRAYSALVFGQSAQLQQYVETVMPLLPAVTGAPLTAVARALHGLAAAERMRAAAGHARAAALADLDESLDWLRERAFDSPENFRHAVSSLEAERAWVLGDFAAASAAFEAALVDVRPQKSPRYRALLAERAGRFHLASGIGRYGMLLLGDARAAYDAWGATGKVLALENEFPALASVRALPAAKAGTISTALSSEAIDMVAVLRASQEISSQTSIRLLEARVCDLLAELTGATSVRLIIRRDDAERWFVSARGDDAAPLSVADAALRGLLPLTVFRYVRRTREPLLLADARRDDRFTRDKYFSGLGQCSMLAVPILSHGELRAIVLLENRLGRGAFSIDRLDAVMLIAGQLAVSLDNALLYASLEKKVADRTDALAAANLQLAAMSRTDALTGLVNRRGFDENLSAVWQQALRMQTWVGLAMIDIDQFKQYNDRYGHMAGDGCLQRVSKALTDGLRPGSDSVARFGGEEFVLILTDTDLRGTLATAERLRSGIAALKDEHVSSAHGVVTISVGAVAFVPAAGETPASYLAKADEALYAAKHGGRNRVEAFGG